MENKLFFEKVTKILNKNLYELKKTGQYGEILTHVGHSKMFKDYTEAWKFYTENREVIDDLVRSGNKVHLPYFNQSEKGVIFCFRFNNVVRQHDKLMNDDIRWLAGMDIRNFLFFPNYFSFHTPAQIIERGLLFEQAPLSRPRACSFCVFCIQR